ncbi:MAG: pilus assembly protein PilM [Candidatus Eisenbacteria bacterium]
MTSTLTDRIAMVGKKVGKVRTMLRRSPAVVSIDEGTSLTKVVHLHRHGGRPHLEYLMCLEGRNPGSMVLQGKRSSPVIVGGVGGHGVRTFFLRFPDMPRKDLDKVIRRTAAKESGSDSLIAWSARRTEPGQTEVLAASAPAHMIVGSFEEMEQAGTAVSQIFPDVLALHECLRVTSPETETSTAAIVNIGNRWTQIAVVDRGNLVFSRSVELGTADMVSGISRTCDIPETEASKLILSKGIDISHLPEDLQERAPVEVLREVTEQMSREILRSFAFMSRESAIPLPKTIFISGGGALIPNLGQTLEAETGIETQILDPLKSLENNVSDEHADLGPVFCVAVGLALLAGRNEPLNLVPQDLGTRKTRKIRATAALAGALISLIVVALTAFALSSTKSDYERLIESRSSVAASLIEMLGPDDADRESLIEEERSYVYSLVVEPQPAWTGVLTEISNLVPAGVLLDDLILVRELSETGEQDVWRLAGTGAVINSDLPPTILTQMESEMENSPVFRDVRVTPLGSTTLSVNGERVDGAILFDMGLYLE